MADKTNYLKLIKQAQLGCRQSMSQLTEAAEGDLYAYIYRLTLNYDLSRDLVQDTLLEMVKSLKNLEFEHANQFWAWLYRTALGKVQLHFRLQNKKKVQMSTLYKEYLLQNASSDYNDGLSDMIRKELSEAIFKAMVKLNIRQRSILILRCFDQKSYSEIAGIMECSEMAAQVLFFRAKRSLKRQLSKQNFGKGILLTSLGLFGCMTAPVKAAPAGPVTAASVKVGFTAAVIGTAAAKLGIAITVVITSIILAAGGVIAVRNSSGNPTQTAGNEVFAYPYQLVNAHDPDNDGWRGVERYGLDPVSISPGKWLVGPPPSKQRAVVLPKNHWIELKFQGEIIDGPGDDILIIESDANGEQAHVFISDGAGKKNLLGVATANTSGQPGHTEIGFDISNIPLPFEACAVRIAGVRAGGTTNGFDLSSVRARIRVKDD